MKRGSVDSWVSAKNRWGNAGDGDGGEICGSNFRPFGFTRRRSPRKSKSDGKCIQGIHLCIYILDHSLPACFSFIPTSIAAHPAVIPPA